MKCWGRTKTYKRCGNNAKFLFCSHHRLQPLKLLLSTIPTLLVTYFSIYAIVIPLFQSDDVKISNKSKLSGFDKFDSSFKILILPFEPLEKCNLKDTKLERAIQKRMLELKEKDTLNINVKIDTSTCFSTFGEGTQRGKEANADIVLWGDLYEKCYPETTKTCLKYSILKAVRLDIPATNTTELQPLNGLEEINKGYLLKDFDFIMYWCLALNEYYKHNFKISLKYLDNLTPDTTFNYIDIFYKKAYCNHELGNYDESINLYNIVSKINNSWPQTNYNKAVAYFDKGYYQNCLKILDSVEVSFPEYKLAKRLKSACLIKLKDYINAKKYLVEYIKLVPNDVMSYLYMGNLYDALGKVDSAMYYFKYAIRLDSNDYVSIMNLSGCYFHQNKIDSALFFINKSISINPNYFLAYYNKAEFLRSERKFDSSIFYCNKSIEINPKFELSLFLRAKDYGDLGKYDFGIQEITKLIEFNPNYSDYYNSRGYLYQMNNQLELALRDLNKAIKLEPNGDMIYCNRGFVYALMGKYNFALKDFEKSIEIEPKNLQVYYLRAETYYMMKKYDKSLTEYLNVLNIISKLDAKDEEMKTKVKKRILELQQKQ